MKCNHSSSMNKQTSNCVHVADVIATLGKKFVLIERLKSPFGLALPGGHVDHGESPKQAATREFTEETGLVMNHVRFVTRRRGKKRDPRYAMSETKVYRGVATGVITNERGFTRVVLLSRKEICELPPSRFAFDHHKILMKFLGETK